MNARKMHLVRKRARADPVAQVQAKTVRISMNAKQTLTTARRILCVPIFWMVSLANRTKDILALREKDPLVETRLTAKATDVHSRTSTNVRTTLTTVQRLRTEIMSCASTLSADSNANRKLLMTRIVNKTRKERSSSTM